MKLVSWNVNGLRAIVQKEDSFLDYFKAVDADIFCLQETKLQAGQIDLKFEGYYDYWNYAIKKGYSGTAVFTKKEPLSVRYGIEKEEHDTEGRVIACEFEKFYLITVYTPNSQGELKRLPYRMAWEEEFLAYILKLEQHKPVIVCGDLNVAHQEIDLKNPKGNRQSPGFSDEERSKFSSFLEAGFIDTFRHFYPTEAERYSWWSYRMGARKRNIGWRIDYFVASQTLASHLVDAHIRSDIMGSDHCPVELVIEI